MEVNIHIAVILLLRSWSCYCDVLEWVLN